MDCFHRSYGIQCAVSQGRQVNIKATLSHCQGLTKWMSCVQCDTRRDLMMAKENARVNGVMFTLIHLYLDLVWTVGFWPHGVMKAMTQSKLYWLKLKGNLVLIFSTNVYFQVQYEFRLTFFSIFDLLQVLMERRSKVSTIWVTFG